MAQAVSGLHVRALATAAAVLVGAPAWAVGSDAGSPPSTTQTSQCPQGYVYSAQAGGCVRIQDSGLSDDQLFENARELAYAGRHDDARAALMAMSEGETSRVLTYLGYLSRKSDEPEAALRHYGEALRIDPDNLLARSYMGQGFAEEGDLTAAKLQLTEIRMRGGRGTWPEIALRMAIESGRGTSY